VDINGGCRGQPDVNHQQGGCFTIRKVGETCVTAENAICENNAKCIYAGDNAGGARCYRLCTSAGAGCGTSETCVTTNDNCGDTLSFCCDSAQLKKDGTCIPTGVNSKRDLGVECSQASDCQSGVCYHFNGQSACSRRCNTVTGAGCPGNVDVNGDAKSDGGFYCAVESGGEGWCWGKNGPAKYLGSGSNGDNGGGCAATTGAAWAGLLGVLALLRWRRR
jgi:hypothetical protein